MKAIGIDVGDTFTDSAPFDSETRDTWVHKRSTGDDPARAVVEGVVETIRRTEAYCRGVSEARRAAAGSRTSEVSAVGLS